MKTTVEISDPLLKRARRIAARDGVTLRMLIENGLARELQSRRNKAEPFKLRRVTADGNGLRPEVAHLSMHDIILLSFENRSE